MKEAYCTYCNHRQKTKSVLKYLTCSSCQKKFLNPYYNKEIPPAPKHIEKKEVKQVKLD